MAINHFKRRNYIFALIKAAMELPEKLQAAAFAQIPSYRSRGKGKERPFIKSFKVRFRSKYNNGIISADQQAEIDKHNDAINTRNLAKFERRQANKLKVIPT